MASTVSELKDRKVSILYGSQTGNGIDVSERIASELQRKWFNINLISMNEYISNLKPFNPNNPFPNDNIIIFVASTTGQGDVPNNMKNFWKFLLRRDLSQQCLSNIQFTTFGLGDSSYRNYNTVARKLHQRLLDLGAQKIHSRGLGDDQHSIGYDFAFIPWLESLSNTMEQMYSIPNGVKIISKNKLIPSKYSIKYRQNNEIKLQHSNKHKNKYFAPLIKHVRLTPDEHWQNVRHLTFDITQSPLQYEPGDVLLLYPLNPTNEILKLCKLLHINNPKNTIISIDYNSDSNLSICKNLSDDLIGLIPHRLSIYELFEKYLDICGVPRRIFFEYLIHFTSDEQHKNKLLQFCSNTSEGQMALYEYNQSESRTFIEVLEDFNSCNIPLNYLISLIPKLKARQFSISSAMEYYYNDKNCMDNNINIDKINCDANKMRKLAEITVALVEYETPLKRKRKGLCSRYIASIPIINGDNEEKKETELIKIALWIEKGSFRFKKDWLSTNVLMVGPGTGIAPFRSMCQYRYYLLNNHNGNGFDNGKVANCLVFFGNRNHSKDFFYKNEWEKMQNKDKNKSSVFKLITAFSRDGERKVYVTDKMRNNDELIWNWISQRNCYIFVAGSSVKMPNDVRNVIIDIIAKYGKKNKKDSEKIVKNLERTRRYQSETWS